MNEAVAVLHEQSDAIPEVVKSELLPLDARRRVVSFKHADKIQSHIFRRITSADWDYFFAHVVSEIRREKGGATTMVDVESASLALYGRAIQDVEGFPTSDGRKPCELKTWPECVHQKFRIRAVKTLMAVGQSRSADDELMLEAESVTVKLTALWNAKDDGTMTSYTGLLHRFACPSAEHRRRFLRAKNRAFVAGGSRAGTTIIPSYHAVLIKLYDELIEAVEGYGIGEEPLRDKNEIVREMDALHKSSAVGSIFQTDLPAQEEEAE